MGKNLLRVLCISVCAASLACAKAPKPAAPQPGAVAEKAPAPAQEAKAAQPPAAQADAVNRAASAAKPLPVKAVSGLQILLTLGRDSSTYPEDFRIGPLVGPKDLTGDDAAAAAAAGAFLAELAKGKIGAALLSPASAAAITASIGYRLSGGSIPSSFRLGAPKSLAGGETAFNVRLFKGEGSAEGEIYLERNDRKWLVSDFQLSLSQLEEKRQETDEKFFPNSYRWLVGE